MLRAMFGSVKYIRGSVSKHSVFVSEVVSNVRQISTARTVFNKVSDDVPKDLRLMDKPNLLEKCILIIASVYKKPSEIPDRVSRQRMIRAYDLARGRVMLFGVLVWSILFLMAIAYGRKLHDAGYSLENEGIKLIESFQEKGRLEREAQKRAQEHDDH